MTKSWLLRIFGKQSQAVSTNIPRPKCAVCGATSGRLTPCSICKSLCCDSHGQHDAGTFVCRDCRPGTSIPKKSHGTSKGVKGGDHICGKTKPDPNLVLAAATGNVQRVAELLQDGADPNSENDAGKTALLEAIEVGQQEVTALLLDWNADPNKGPAKSRHFNPWVATVACRC